ncbi:platelet glycoprotein Ib alpha chain [Copidosoma floridanum]|uniref:platelet glycoprotein Ib alpha chain n=1 Tax=Copidosoma floridanum TaxID=29053 RepID=UPI0006C9DD9E|nr:platelet glycoprotein Ib alpha chain [Copidosoma floridanum]XP_014215909.1 platelet glycoprotein Ib alpha chain [Copidosoma floridanum]XP_014215911.1 platelet glycoprotein Ib alpha chain [Copidosoma floridanum]XP_014215912.1 platelet glycoprotein Ib alpha chain [Copidosoma floridanum]XP_014215913.1 platelet glycoprotein Ib alpha chain [Copidosoma floridanum]
MKPCKLTCLLVLSCLALVDPASALCTLSHLTSAQCHELEDTRSIDTHQLHDLRAPTSLKVLAPDNFRNLTNLRHLDLSGGKVENITSGTFAKLGSLQTLNLAENRIKYLEPGALDGLKQLHSLKLDDNNVTQLPVALTSLKKLRFLDLSSNPMNCDCASMKLRDVLLARGVRISKKTLCAEPISARDTSILKPNSTTTCAFEGQDREMQGDQPAETEAASDAKGGEDEALNETGEPASNDDKKGGEQPPDNETERVTVVVETSQPSRSTEEPSLPPSATTPAAEVVEDASPVAVSTTSESATTEKADVPKDPPLTTEIPLVTAAVELEEPKATEAPEGTTEPTDPEESKETERDEAPVESSATEASDILASSTELEKINLIASDEGSGDAEDDGSGFMDSGMIAPNVPEHIDFNQTHEASGEEESDKVSSSSAPTTSTSTTESLSWWGVISSINLFGTNDASTPPSTTKSAEDDLKEEQFIKVFHITSTESERPAQEPTVSPKVLLQDEALPKKVYSAYEGDTNDDMGANDSNVDVERNSKEWKHGMGSYLVLSALLIILLGLIVTAAYKGDFCRRKHKRRDVERGKELKDMKKTLLDQNVAQSKIQASNGVILENVPLMNSSTPPEEPKDNQTSYDITPANGANGTSRSNGYAPDINDPVKPPRKSYHQGIEAPLNGLNPPMEDIDGPDSPCLHNGSQDDLDSYEDKPPLSPGAQRVKITMQDNPDSVAKTPILITRLNDGENLVKTP